MSWIKFKNRISTEFGTMEKVPIMPSSEPQIKTIDIPYGTPVFLQQGWKSAKTENFSLGIKNITPETIYAVYEWLTGYGMLQTSLEPDVYFKAIVASSSVTRNVSKRLGKVEFNFTLEPFRYAISNEFINYELSGDGQKSFEVHNEGSIDSYAEYEITVGDGEWIIWNNGQYLVYNFGAGKCRINTEYCSLMREDGVIIQVNPLIRRLMLKPGDNYLTVTSNVESVKIKRNMRWY